ncbi:MAG: serine hydrolase [Parcubacteria group bacterium]
MLINFLIALLLLSPINSAYLSDNLFFDMAKTANAVVPVRINPENIGVKVGALRYAAIDADSGKLLLQKDMSAPQPLASITKLMTAMVILDQKPDWQKTVELTRNDETVGAYPHIYRGEQVKFIDLWKNALIASDNNSILAMVRILGYSTDQFASLMNAKAQELQMYNSEFKDPTGLSANNVSTALDVSRLVYNAMKKNEIRESVLQSGYKFKILNNKKSREIHNTDVLVSSFLNDKSYGYELIGGKTGYLPEAGYCLAASIKKDNRNVIIVVLDSGAIADRFQDVKVIADWVFSNYQWEKGK